MDREPKQVTNMPDTISIGRDGALTIPLAMRRRLGLGEGTQVMIEETRDGLMIRPIFPEPETYTSERKAEFLLNNAIGADDYQAARAAVRSLGLDPETIPHERRAE